MNRYEYVEGTSCKFWQYEVRGKQLVVEYGRIGGKPQSTTKEFGTEEEAERAAEKLVKEKTAKGYALVGAAADGDGSKPPAKEAKAAKAGKSSEPAAHPAAKTASPTTFRAFARQIDLKKVKVDDGEDEHGPGLWPRLLWALAEAGLLKKADAFTALKYLAPSVELGSPEAILSVLRLQPSKVPAPNVLMLLDDYTPGMDALLMHLAFRAPALLQQHEKELPANVRRALPIVRSRLGQEAKIDPAWMDELARTWPRSYDCKEPLVMLRDGKLQKESAESWASVCDLAAYYGDVGDWQAKARQAATADDGTIDFRSRTEVFFLKASMQELTKITGRTFGPQKLADILSKRTDSLDDLLELFGLLAGESRLNVVAAFAAGAALREKKPLPDEVAEAFTFDPPYGHEDLYVSSLRALDRETVLEEAATLADSDDEDERARAAVALAAFYEDELFRSMLANPDVEDLDASKLGLVGRPGLDALREAISSAEDDDGFFKEAFAHAAARASATEGFVLDPKDDALLAPGSDRRSDPVRVLLQSWPADRRTAWLEAQRGGRGFKTTVLTYADFAPEAMLEAAVAEVLKMDADSVLANAGDLEGAGPVVEQVLLRMLARRKGDKKLLQLLDWMRLSDDARAAASRVVFGAEPSAPAPLANEERLFSDETTAALLAGKQVAGPMDPAALRALCAQLDAMARELGVPLAIAVGADLGNTPAGSKVKAVVGIEVQRADTSAAQEIDTGALESAQRAAATLPWERVAKALPSGWSQQAADPEVVCIASGPLAVAKLAFGKLVEAEDEQGEDLIYGVTMEQESKMTPVRGLLVASASYDGEAVCPVSLSSPPFSAEKKKLGRRSKNAAGFLIASYDF